MYNKHVLHLISAGCHGPQKYLDAKILNTKNLTQKFSKLQYAITLYTTVTDAFHQSLKMKVTVD